MFNRIKPRHIADDLKQYVFLLLLEKPDDFIKQLHSEGNLKKYVCKMMINLTYFQPRKKTMSVGGFNISRGSDIVQLVGSFDDIAEMFDSPEDCHIKHETEHILNNLESEVDNLYWYHKGILELYVELGSYRAVERNTGIPFKSVGNSINLSKKQIKDKLCMK